MEATYVRFRQRRAEKRRHPDRRHHLLYQYFSNPAVLLAAGLLAKKAVEAGLQVSPTHQDFAGSRFQNRDQLSWRKPVCCLIWKNSVSTWQGYGCTTCIGNAGDLTHRDRTKPSSRTMWSQQRYLSGNRNFEARIHPNIRANFLAWPPLVVAYAIAGERHTRSDDGTAGQRQGWQGRLSVRLSGRPRMEVSCAGSSGSGCAFLPQELQRHQNGSGRTLAENCRFRDR